MHKVIHILWITMRKDYFSIIHNSYLLVDKFFYTIEIQKEKRKRRSKSGVQHLLHLKSKSKILRPIEIMGFFYEFFCQI